jgi:hypothetical protein
VNPVVEEESKLQITQTPYAVLDNSRSPDNENNDAQNILRLI